ncbi:MAG: crossover junction endodeoxyribonuclease RuvC, partial [Bifidobacteriaceae bacterium]|jgi:crossover junction endodeoxyribonuclease RuvC|nr:crossover junction endodeoxyribonuclease RuvC [Bifidobacteriaceae bacterium]
VGVERTAASQTLDRRLLALDQLLGEWLDRWQPAAVAVERPFARRDVSTITATAQVAGIAMVAAARRNIPVALHTPTEVKAAVTGNGRAPKEQVQRMIARLLSLPEVPNPPDAADALAVAICHAWRPSSLSALPDAHTDAQKAWLEAERAAKRR